MFERLRPPHYLKKSATADRATVAIDPRAARIARVHQYGLRDSVDWRRAGSPTVRYARRELLGLIKAEVRAYMFDPGNSTTPAAPAASGGSTTHMVSITLPDGTTGAVNAATANDAENLSKLLSRLGSARRVG